MNPVRRVAATVMVALAVFGCGGENSHSRTTALKVSVGQTTAEFSQLNSGAEPFQSPVHPGAGGFAIFHNLESITLLGAGLSTPITFPALQGAHGSAVVSFDTYDTGRDRSRPETVQKVAYRPAFSVNTPQATQAEIRKIIGVLSRTPSCVGGDYSGPDAIDLENDLASSSEMLAPYLKTYLAATKAYFCGDMIVTFEVMTSNLNRSVAKDSPGFDIHLYVQTKQDHERAEELFKSKPTPQQGIQPDVPASGRPAG